MNIRSLTAELKYCGEVEAKRQTYYVFEGKRYFFVMSFSRSKKNAGNFNVVEAAAVRYVVSKFAGRQSVTSSSVATASRKPQYISKPLEALNILYILVAAGRARIDTRFRSRQLYFNIKQ